MPRDSFQIALEHHRGGRLRQAEAGYRAALRDEPDHPDALHWLGVLTLQAGRPGAAIPLLARAAARRPTDLAFAHNLGQALLSAGRAGDAIAVLERVLKLHPGHAASRMALGLARLARNVPEDSPGALAALEQARDAGLDSAELHHHLGVAFLKVGRADDAIASCRAAIERRSDYASAHHHLALAHRAKRDLNAARRALERAVEVDPTFARALHGLAVLEAEAGKLDAAAALFRRAIEAKGDYAAAYDGLARVLALGGRGADAARVTEEASRALDRPAAAAEPAAPASVSAAIAELEGKLTPDGDATQLHYALATLLNVFPPAQSPAPGITKLFDGYAGRFDEHLQGKLGYRVPEMLARAIADTRPAHLLDVLDLGCGTGLCGAALRPLARTLRGVDLSPAMVEKAQARGVYDEVILGEMLAPLRDRAGAFDLIVATDVLIYVGDLAPVFDAAAQALRPGGMLAFSVEAGAGDRYYLQPKTRRYAHAQPYVQHLADIYGFVAERFETIPVRVEGGRPLPGYLVVLRMAG
jgi:predicted TPR repeat methyltransferase